MAEELNLSSTIRFRCNFGGNILPSNGNLLYFGGHTRIGVIDRSISFATLLHKLTTLSATTNNISVKYHLPYKGLDSLISLVTDEDVKCMMEEFEHFEQIQFPSPTCLPFFLFSDEDKAEEEEDEDSRSNVMSSLLKGSAMRENWFRDALNCVVEGGCSDYESEVDHHQPLLNDNELESLISELNLYEGGQVEGSSISAQPVVAYQTHHPSMFPVYIPYNPIHMPTSILIGYHPVIPVPAYPVAVAMTTSGIVQQRGGGADQFGTGRFLSN